MFDNLFNNLKSNLRNASQTPPASCVVLGFTQAQMLTMQLKNPMVLWYDKATNTYYNQGSARKIPKSKWMKINAENCNRNKPVKDLKYYILMNNQMIAESDKPL